MGLTFSGLGYWNESLKSPKKIQFLKYENLNKEPKIHVKELAEFLEKPFRNYGEADEVSWRCSIEGLKNLEDDQEFLVFLEYENCTNFCHYCGLVGHSISDCKHKVLWINKFMQKQVSHNNVIVRMEQ